MHKVILPNQTFDQTPGCGAAVQYGISEVILSVFEVFGIREVFARIASKPNLLPDSGLWSCCTLGLTILLLFYLLDWFCSRQLKSMLHHKNTITINEATLTYK